MWSKIIPLTKFLLIPSLELFLLAMLGFEYYRICPVERNVHEIELANLL